VSNLLLANDFTVLYESPDPARIFAYTPGLTVLKNGRLFATMDQGGPGVADLPGPKGFRGEGIHAWQGIIWTSDDKGGRWVERGRFPFMHARPLVVGDALYVLGHDADLCIMRSGDEGVTWSDPVYLTEGQHWHQSACNVHYRGGYIYLVMERRTRFEHDGWPVSELAPVLMRARVQDDLTLSSSWSYASELSFYEIEGVADLSSVPLWKTGRTDRAGKRVMNPPGWLETNVVEFTDPGHVWHDPEGRTLHLWMRAHTGGTQLACMAKVVEGPDGVMRTELEQTPAGNRVLYVPCPGGHMRFHMLWDASTELYWLLSSVATDSMRRPDQLPSERFNLPNNERHILGLYFSRNCLDWCFAGIVARGETPRQARHYASMAIVGEDLFVLSRSGDARAHSAHDGNLITLHTVRSFRNLVYI
jgi:hypothetical protein